MALNTKRKYSILTVQSQDLNSVLLLKQNNVCNIEKPVLFQEMRTNQIKNESE